MRRAAATHTVRALDRSPITWYNRGCIGAAIRPVFLYPEVEAGIPVVVLYPGRSDGQELALFDGSHDGNDCRAFSML